MSFTDDSSREITPLKLYFEGKKKKKSKLARPKVSVKAPALNLTAQERKMGTTLQRDLNITR